MAAAVAVLAAVVIGAILISKMGQGSERQAGAGTTSEAAPRTLPPEDSSADSTGSGATPGAQSSPGEQDSQTSDEPEKSSTSSEPEESSSSESSTSSASGPELSGSGYDRQGWTQSGQARCNADDPAQMVAHSTKSYVVICARADNGAQYYRAYRTTDGKGIEISNPTRTGAGWHVANKGTNYYITSSNLRIVSPSGKELANETMGTYDELP